MQPVIIKKTVFGEPASAKNQRRIVFRKDGRPAVIKSEKALSYSESFRAQFQPIEELITGDVYLHIDAFYATRRPDLACLELVKDLLQGIVYKNDRQVKIESASWSLDPSSPRVSIAIIDLSSAPYTGTFSLAQFETLVHLLRTT